jgi:type VI secretion system protein ImpA
MITAPKMSVEDLLAPVSEDAPCGTSMRSEPLFTEIRLAREEDDASLSMRHWERPLKVADWPTIESRCSEAMAHQSKDLQIAAWLLEAWVRQYQLRGLLHGLKLLTGLIERYWEPLFPVMDDDDVDARLAPFEWLNDSLPRTLKLHVSLVYMADRKPASLNLADWSKMTKAELSQSAEGRYDDEIPENTLTRSLVIAYAAKLADAHVAKQKNWVRQCQEELASLDAALRTRLANNSPSTSNISNVLDQIGRALHQIVPDHVNPSQVETTDTNHQEETQRPDTETVSEFSSGAVLDQPLEATSAIAVTVGWQTREQAYKALESIAAFLHKTEPHSPTPYLIKRAVSWGQMTLPELMAEVIREEGDLNKLINLLGLVDKNKDQDQDRD